MDLVEPIPARSSNSAFARGTLSKPIAIPSLNTEIGSPYLRAYPPCLSDYGISCDTFLRFLDRLNNVSVESPPLVILGLGASVVSLIPEPTTALIGTAVQMGIQATSEAISKGRTELHLAEANKEIFGPCGLKVQLAKLEALAKIASIPILDDKGKLLPANPKKKKNDVEERLELPIRLLSPIEDLHELHTLSAQHRRVKALAPWTMPLNLDNLPGVFATVQDEDSNEADGQKKEGESDLSVMAKLHQYASDYDRKTGEKKFIKDRKKALDRVTEDRQKAQEKYEKKLRELDKDEARLQEKIMKKGDRGGSNGKMESKLEKITSKRLVDLPGELDEKMDKIQKKYEKKDREEKGIRKIHFLIITGKEDIERQTEEGGLDAEGLANLLNRVTSLYQTRSSKIPEA